MRDALHILDRFLIHFTAATALLLMAAIGWRAAARKYPQRKFFPRSMEQTLLYSALSTFGAAVLREAFDVAAGQTTTKAVFDYASWFLGLGFGAWGLYRWHYFSWEAK